MLDALCTYVALFHTAELDAVYFHVCTTEFYSNAVRDFGCTAECQMHCEPTCMYVHCTLSSIATSTCCLIFGYTLCTTVSDMLLVFLICC